MYTLKSLQKLDWFKSDWRIPRLSDEARALLQQYSDLAKPNISDDIDDIIKRSDEFPIEFPIDTVRLKTLKESKPIRELKRNIASTYPLVHERVLRLMAEFLIYKREYGSIIEKAFYKEMTVPDLIDRILKKRAMTFMSKYDKYMLISGDKGKDGWEEIGTSKQKEPLTLDTCLSYDELKLSAMLFVSSYTSCINDGARKNLGVVKDGVEDTAVIIGVIGPRFQRESRMDCEDILISQKQNCKENGFGREQEENNSKVMYRKLWANFYETKSLTYDKAALKLPSNEKSNKKMKKDEMLYTHTFVPVGKGDPPVIFNNDIYHKRLSIIFDCSLAEAETRGIEAEKNVFLNVIGCGLGVWKMSPHQNDIYVLSFVQRIRSLLQCASLSHVTDVNFAYIKASRTLKAHFKTSSEKGVLESFIPNQDHPKGGIKIYLNDREPSSKLKGQHEGKLLVMTYPWDGNAHPGNEFWIGKLGSSGDPAAACSTQISELHNAYINTAVCSRNTKIVSRTQLLDFAEYCQQL